MKLDIRIRFNSSWFVFYYSSWSFHESYFSRNPIFHESYRVNRTQGYGLKTNKQVPNYSVLSWFWKNSYRRFPASTISLSSKRKSQIEKMRHLTLQTLSISFTLVPEEHFVKLYNTRKFDLSCSMEMYHFQELPLRAKRNI